MTTTPDIRTVIIEPRRAAREALAALVEGTPGYRLAGSFGSADEAGDRLDLHSPDVLVLGLDAEHDPARSIRTIKDRYPSIQILVRSGDATEEEIAARISAGATGYLLHDAPPARLMEAIRELRDGGAPMSPYVARVVVGSFHALSKKEGSSETRLSRREQDTLRLLAAGHSYKTTAAELGLSIDTVRFHVRNIYEKLHVHSKIEAVLKAKRDGLVS